LLDDILHPGLERVVLAHLSETNNTPEKALAEVSTVLSGTPIRLTAASQSVPSPVWRMA
jgi:phosphoribosyl 1,2-cyclic phosphodiesterase